MRGSKAQQQLVIVSSFAVSCVLYVCVFLTIFLDGADFKWCWVSSFLLALVFTTQSRGNKNETSRMVRIVRVSRARNRTKNMRAAPAFEFFFLLAFVTECQNQINKNHFVAKIYYWYFSRPTPATARLAARREQTAQTYWNLIESA